MIWMQTFDTDGAPDNILLKLILIQQSRLQ